jgi:AraC-like DNA-binding protein
MQPRRAEEEAREPRQFLLNLLRQEPAETEVVVDGRAVHVVPFPQGTLCLVSLIIDPVADDGHCEEAAILYVRRSSFDWLTDQLGAARLRDLPLSAGAAAGDRLMARLGDCLLPAVEQPENVNKLVVDQIASAVHTHLVQRFAELSCLDATRKTGLAPWQLRLAQKSISEHPEMEGVIAQAAKDCRLSISHFTRAFTASTGTSPHRWLTRCRVERATHLLRTSRLSLSEIGLTCGFFDQSHFNRVFARHVGLPPGQWRRLHQSPAEATLTTVQSDA